jgi:phosphatidylglycerophosphate synthase
VTVAEYRKICQKGEYENYLFDKFIFRKISIFVTIIFIKLRIGANQTTMMNFVALLGSLYFLAFNDTSMMVVGIVLIFTYYLLDHVDGELARFYISTGQQNPSRRGHYFDLVCHSYSANLLLFVMGISVYHAYHYEIAIIIGFIASVGSSSFPGLTAASIMIMVVNNRPQLISEDNVKNALYHLERRQKQLDEMQSPMRSKTRIKKILNEAIIFPGILLLIISIYMLDILFSDFILFGIETNFRLIFLVLISALYTFLRVAQVYRWMNRFSNIP